MPSLSLRFRNRADANAQLVLTREDGSFTAGDIGPPMGYGPAHDLAHYVVESTLVLAEGFLGLVASGWDIADFEVKGMAARLPAEALFAETAAGQLSSEHMLGQPTSAEDFNWSMRAKLQPNHPDFVVPGIDGTQLEGMRARLMELHCEWFAVAPGAVLELEFRSLRRATCPRPSPPLKPVVARRR
jgi:hypothetical protein